MNHNNAGDQFLETMVLSAPPAKLRLMLLELGIQKCNEAIELATSVGRVSLNEHTLTLRETLDELLSGIRPSDEELPHQVADLYVFLLQWLTTAELEGELQKLTDIRRVLEIERETWAKVCVEQTAPAVPAPMGSFASEDSICFDA